MLNIPGEIKNLILTDGTRKNIRITFPNGERDDITNENIVRNSVKFTESLCSQDELRFGLCEASTFECELVGIENIKKMKIEAQMEIDCSSLGETWCDENAQTADDVDYPFYVIPYGVFTVDSCQKQADMSHRRLVAYSYDFDFKINRIELFKQGLKVSSKIKYKTNYYKYFLSNINNLDGFGFEKVDADYDFIEVDSEYNDFTLIKEYLIANFSDGYAGNQASDLYEIHANWNKGIVEDYESYVGIKLQNRLYLSTNVSLSELDKTFYDFIEKSDQKTTLCFYPYFSDLNEYFNGNFDIYIPVKITVKRYEWNEEHTDEHLIETRVFDLGRENFKIYKFNFVSHPYSNMSLSLERTLDSYSGKYKVVHADDKYSIDEVESVIEMSGKFMKFNRYGQIEIDGVDNISGLYPAETLYPSETLYPKGTQGYSVPSTYASAWYEDELTKPYGRVQATFKNDSEEEETVSIDIVDDFNYDDYLVYDMSNNYLIKEDKHLPNNVRTWMQAVADNIADVRYMPCEIKSLGMPWIEAGDTIALETTDGDILKTIILARTLTGEQYLTDSFDSKG